MKLRRSVVQSALAILPLLGSLASVACADDPPDYHNIVFVGDRVRPRSAGYIYFRSGDHSTDAVLVPLNGNAYSVELTFERNSRIKAQGWNYYHDGHVYDISYGQPVPNLPSRLFICADIDSSINEYQIALEYPGIHPGDRPIWKAAFAAAQAPKVYLHSEPSSSANSSTNETK